MCARNMRDTCLLSDAGSLRDLKMRQCLLKTSRQKKKKVELTYKITPQINNFKD